MPLPLIPLIAAGVALAGSAINASSTAAQNRKQREFSEEMYGRQRSDALTDFAMQNSYNSPAATMERLKAAGLNPNLVYGNGATTTAAPIRSSSVESWKPTPPQIDTSGITGPMMDIYDVRLKQAQTDNLEAARKVSEQDAILRAAQISQTLQGIKSSEVKTETDAFNLTLLKRLETNTLETADAQLNKLRADTSFTMDSNERQAALSANTIAKSLEEVLNLRAQRNQTSAQTEQTRQSIENLKKEGKLKDLDIKLKEHGLQPHDPLYQRIIKTLIDKIPSPKEFKQAVDNFIRNLGARRMGM